ncbi:ATP-binding protein [Chryseobacterium sp. SSA4.19]|uniref:PAS domain-containing sensor histidine kinase n=1 Tax=Chryseobacterium sp. SSA4.19 TaxID=2919915 RepID=UPI001F4DF3CD|nr:ATP-binding protein [Chryseobacterium sp. SSA4.19]MCJ8155663.1 ATP-binding protein [Chryseobacterium sp. SSA4.19]
MNTEEKSGNASFGQDLILKALSSSPEPTSIYTGTEMTIQFANEGMLSLWGKDASIIGKALMIAIPELDDQPFFSILEEVWRSGKSYSVTDAPARLIKNGVPVTDYFDYEYRALLDKNHKTWCILNTARNVTLRREHQQQMQEKEEKEQGLMEEMAATMEELSTSNDELNDSLMLLAESREHVRTIIEQAPVGIAMLQGPELIIEIANPAILKIWGHHLADVQGLPHETARPELEGQPVNQWLRETFEKAERKTNSEFSVMLQHNGGLREAIVNSIYQPVFSSDHKVTGVLIILDEITDQVLERRKNEKDQQMLALAIEAGDLATFYYEPATNLFSGNTLLKSWFGLADEELLDLSVAVASISEQDRERVIAAIGDALSEDSDGNYFIEYRIVHPHKPTGRLVQARGKVFYDTNGNAMSLNGTLRDITEQKAEEQRKNDFISIVSHELKTPLTSINAWLQMMQRQAILAENATQQDITDKSLRQVRNMNSLINGFLNISRLDSGRMMIEHSEFDLKELFSELEDEFQSRILTHKIVVDHPQALQLNADRNKMSQVIQNLVENAVKYSPVGTEIKFGYSATENKTVEIFVIDQGMGIAEEDRDQIFDRYYRADKNRVGSISGFGIGLYLCREIVEIHNGHISVKSNTEGGSTFKVLLPI